MSQTEGTQAGNSVVVVAVVEPVHIQLPHILNSLQV